jgi:hypothetical protein
VLGFALGGFIPVATYVVSHYENPGWDVGALIVGGGLLFSARTVFLWSRMAFGGVIKALGFVVLLEGVMVTSETRWLALAALGYLVCINGVATACALALGKSESRGGASV